MRYSPFHRRSPLLVLACALLAATVACSMPSLGGEAELPDDGQPVPVSQQAAASFVTKVIVAGEQATNQQSVRFTVTEQEVTSALSYGAELAAYSQGGPMFEGLGSLPVDDLPADQLPPEAQRFRDLAESLGGLTGDREGSGGGLLPDLRLKLEEPQVYFRADGRMIVRGYGVLWRWRQPLRVVIAPRASEGELELDFVEGQLGSLPLPEFLFDPLGNLLSQALLAGQDYAAITELTVGDGVLTFAGELRVPLQEQP
ncbi:MAG: hypothetical protein R3191_00560 [Anaerolineales bacterium]|nr:hypothetical protein [Anaerolineales bacterium]